MRITQLFATPSPKFAKLAPGSQRAIALPRKPNRVSITNIQIIPAEIAPTEERKIKAITEPINPYAIDERTTLAQVVIKEVENRNHLPVETLAKGEKM